MAKEFFFGSIDLCEKQNSEKNTMSHPKVTVKRDAKICNVLALIGAVCCMFGGRFLYL